VVAGVPLGRVINPDFNGANRGLYEIVQNTRFTFERCRLET
jgi:hypothetical protein